MIMMMVITNKNKYIYKEHKRTDNSKKSHKILIIIIDTYHILAFNVFQVHFRLLYRIIKYVNNQNNNNYKSYKYKINKIKIIINIMVTITIVINDSSNLISNLEDIIIIIIKRLKNQNFLISFFYP